MLVKLLSGSAEHAVSLGTTERGGAAGRAVALGRVAESCEQPEEAWQDDTTVRELQGIGCSYPPLEKRSLRLSSRKLR